MLDFGNLNCQSAFMNKTNVTHSVLVVPPTYFKVDYVINPFMRTVDGELNHIDTKKSKTQWNALQQVYLDLGINVMQVAPSEMHPDMVFTANQLLPFRDSRNKDDYSFVLSHMATAERAGEVIFFKKWAEDRGHQTYQLKVGPFEGMGDALWTFNQEKLFVGHGFRTHADVPKELFELIQKEVISLQLVSPYFYHLDTCLSILNDNTCAYVKDAFDEKSLETIKSNFEKTIEVPFEEAKDFLACNMFCPDGETVIIEQQNRETIKRLIDFKFRIKAVDTSEFLKSGGSVFCLKLAL